MMKVKRYFSVGLIAGLSCSVLVFLYTSSLLSSRHRVDSIRDTSHDARSGEASIREALIPEASTREATIRKTPKREALIPESSIREASKGETPVREAPVREAPIPDAAGRKTHNADVPNRDASNNSSSKHDAYVHDAPRIENYYNNHTTSLTGVHVVSYNVTHKKTTNMNVSVSKNTTLEWKPAVCPSSGKPTPELTSCLLDALHSVPAQNLPRDLEKFNPKFNRSVHDELLEILEVFSQSMDAHNITYFMAGGTLIGSWRHHGFIPWDDDVDVYMDVEDKPNIKAALMKLHSRYGSFTLPNAPRWKLYLNKHHRFENTTYNWAFPFLDICFYEHHGIYITDIDEGFRNFRYEIGSVFPVVKRPFYHLYLSAPADTYSVLSRNYELTACVSGYWDHMIRNYIKDSKRVRCNLLRPYFPFVRHAFINTPQHKEFMMLGDQILYTIKERP